MILPNPFAHFRHQHGRYRIILVVSGANGSGRVPKAIPDSIQLLSDDDQWTELTSQQDANVTVAAPNKIDSVYHKLRVVWNLDKMGFPP